MGSWFAVKNGIGYTYAAIADTMEEDPREKFKCLVSFSTVYLKNFVSDPYQTRLFHSYGDVTQCFRRAEGIFAFARNILLLSGSEPYFM